MAQVEINRRVHYKPKSDSPTSLSPEEVVFAEIEIESEGKRYYVYSEWREPNQTAVNPDSSVSKPSRFDIEAEIVRIEAQGVSANEPKLDMLYQQIRNMERLSNDAFKEWIRKAEDEVQYRFAQIRSDN